MADAKDDSDDEVESGFSLSSILFGNVNKDGELIDGFLDKVSLLLFGLVVMINVFLFLK